MKKLLIWIGVLILSISMIAIFSVAAEKPVKEIKLTFWNGFTGPDGAILREIVDRFNKEQAGKINIEMDIMPWAVFYQKLPPAISTGTAPSFVLSGPSMIPQWVDSGALLPLDDFWTVTGINKDDINQVVLDLCLYDEKYYSIPMQQFNLPLYWNKDLFTEAGLDPEKPPETWDELAEYAAKITDPSKEQYGFGIPVRTAPQFFTSLIWANGGDIVDLVNRKSVLNSPENVESFAFLQNLAKNSPKGITGPELDNLIMAGKLGMYINGPWLVNGLRENNINFGVAAPPRGKVGQFTLVDISSYQIPSTTTSEEEKLAVYKFLAYWNSYEIGKEWSMRNGFPPYLKSVIEDEDIQNDYVLSVISKFGDISRAYLPGINEATLITDDVMWPLIEAIVFGKNVETEVQKASEKVDTILAGENK